VSCRQPTRITRCTERGKVSVARSVALARLTIAGKTPAKDHEHEVLSGPQQVNLARAKAEVRVGLRQSRRPHEREEELLGLRAGKGRTRVE
jgi:hypothetical protein